MADPQGGEGPTKGVADLNWVIDRPRRHNFANPNDYRLALGLWLVIFSFLALVFFCQSAVVFRRWNMYDNTVTDVEEPGDQLAPVPYLDVCEDGQGEDYDSSDFDPFVTKASNPGSDVIVSAACRWFLNGKAVDGTVDNNTTMHKQLHVLDWWSDTAERTYFEPANDGSHRHGGRETPKALKPGIGRRTLREEDVSNATRYRCYRFAPPNVTRRINYGDRVHVKWKVEVKGKVPESRLTSYQRGTKDEVKGLLYRISLSKDAEDGWAFHREGVHHARINKDRTRRVLVTGKQHAYKWVNSFAIASTVQNSMKLFNVVMFDDEHRYFPNKMSEGAAADIGEDRAGMIFRIHYTTMDVSSTAYTCDSWERLLTAFGSLVGMVTMFAFVGVPFESVKKTEPDKLVLRMRKSISGLEQDQHETEPLLHAEE